MIKVYDFMQKGTTYKGIGAVEMVEDALLNGVNTMCVISSGNLSSSLRREIRSLAEEAKGIKLVNLVNQKPSNDLDIQIPPRRILRNAAEREAWVTLDNPAAGKVKDYTDYIPRALEGIAREILAGSPDFVSLGVGGGKLFFSIYREIQNQGLPTKLIGIVPKGENGVFNDNQLEEDERGNLFFRNGFYKSIADKLSTPYTFYRPQLIEACSQGHKILEATNRDFKWANTESISRGLEAEMSGSAGFIILNPEFTARHELEGLANNNGVIVSTGKGSGTVIRKEIPGAIKLLLPLACAAGLVYGSILGISKIKKDEEFRKLERETAISYAAYLSTKLGEFYNVANKPTSEIWNYIRKNNDRLGGPAHYR